MAVCQVRRLLLLVTALSIPAGDARCLDIKDKISPLDSRRPVRQATKFVILHTTEAPRRSSLNEVCRYGEANYFVGENGEVLRIIDRNKVAYHAGRSMWNGETALDNVSVGIEVVGYHNRDITAAQYIALRELVEQLQKVYRVPDDRVLTHSMVAYGAPNRWHRRSHRGRKRCGMIFAAKEARRQIGLEIEPAFDPDVKAGRLMNADPELARFLYASASDQARMLGFLAKARSNVIGLGRSAWDIARDQYNAPGTIYELPDGKRYTGDRVQDWRSLPEGTKVTLPGYEHENALDGAGIVGGDVASVLSIAGDEWNAPSTLFILPSGRMKAGNELSAAEVSALPVGTRVLVGYTKGGTVTAKKSAFEICGGRWNLPSTLYRLPEGRLVTGNEVGEKSIPAGTQVFYAN
jgi:hypothetical protein